jgi:hypothetical protein
VSPPCAQDVQRAGWDSRSLPVTHEPFAEALRIDRCAQLVGEDQVVISVGIDGEVAFKHLRVTMVPQRVHRLGVERDRTP